jgi:hypothetical protein
MLYPPPSHVDAAAKIFAAGFFRVRSRDLVCKKSAP